MVPTTLELKKVMKVIQNMPKIRLHIKTAKFVLVSVELSSRPGISPMLTPGNLSWRIPVKFRIISVPDLISRDDIDMFGQDFPCLFIHLAVTWPKNSPVLGESSKLTSQLFTALSNLKWFSFIGMISLEEASHFRGKSVDLFQNTIDFGAS